MLTAALLAIAIPEVILSEEHRAQTKVVVGDEFPAIEATNAAGERTAVSDTLAGRIGVIVVPGGPDWMNAMMAKDLRDDFVVGYGGKPIGFVALGEIDQRDAAAEGKGLVTLKPEAARLADALGRIETPRVYVVDKQGKLVWFDLEYTLSTHRELHAVLDELTAE